MLQYIEVNDETDNIEKFNAAAKQAHDHPDTHGLLVKIYADWCIHCQNMKADWKRLIHHLEKNYHCKKEGCVLTIANIRAVNLEPSDPIIQKLKYIPKDIQGVPLIMYVRKGARSLEYSEDRIYSKMLNWIISNPDFELVRNNKEAHKGTITRSRSRSRTLRGITKKAHPKFKEFHRDTLKRFHNDMKRQHKKSVKARMATPVASHHNHNNGRRYVPAYLR
jgi:thiol-disulfide isomerase/thioredoxin